MKGVMIGSLLGSIVLFVWGFLYWGVLPVTDDLLEGAPPALAQEVRDLPRSGVYTVPDMALYDQDEAEYNRQHESGPIAMLFVRKQGTQVGSPATFGMGFLHMFASALLIALILRSIAAGMPSYGSRVLFVLVAGSAGAFMSDIGPIIWWLQPAGMHVANFVYHVVGWGLLGLVLGRAVRPATTPTLPTELKP